MVGLLQKMSNKMNALCHRVHVRRYDYSDLEQASAGGVATSSESRSGSGSASRLGNRTKTASCSIYSSGSRSSSSSQSQCIILDLGSILYQTVILMSYLVFGCIFIFLEFICKPNKNQVGQSSQRLLVGLFRIYFFLWCGCKLLYSNS